MTRTLTGTQTRTERIRSIDILRGATIVAMLLVNNPGDGTRVLAPLRHSPWHGCTFADLVFPSFLFLVGITTELAAPRSTTRGILRRAGLLFGIGLLLNAYPFFEKHAIGGPSWLPPAIGHVVARLSELRLLGVLQRIGLAFGVAALVSCRRSTRTVAAVTALLLIGYWIVLTLLPADAGAPWSAGRFADPQRTLPVIVDRALLDWERWGLGWHLWDRAASYEPEGLLSTFPAIASVLTGVLCARWTRGNRAMSRTIRGLLLAGAAATLAGILWSIVFPINKPIWSSSYVLFTSGITSIVLAACMWLVDLRRPRWGLTPFLVFGSNAIVAYVGSELLANILRSGLRWRVGDARFGSGMAVVRALENAGVDPAVASFIYAALFTVLCGLLLLPLYRRGRFVRV